MNTTPSSSPAPNSRQRALILGGGGSTGNAWLIGVVAGLHEAGLDVTDADLIVGTSAGSTAAAQITGADPARLYAEALVAPPQRQAPAASASAGAGGFAGPATSAQPVIDHLKRTDDIIAAATDAADMRRRMGASALDLAAASDGSWSTRWRAIVAARLPGQDWPRQDVRITAVDADTGDGVVFDRDSGVDLADAVAASTSSGAAYGIGEASYIDGGYRTNADNADLAAGYERVLALSPFGGRSRLPFAWGLHLANQVDELRASGSRVETIVPGGDAEHLFGPNGMDLSLRPAAARAGYEQGRAMAEQLAGFWL